MGSEMCIRDSRGLAHARQIEQALAACKRTRDMSTQDGGTRSIRVLRGAASAARSTYAGDAIDEQAWTNRYALLAGCLPAWADDGDTTPAHGHEHTRATTDAIVHGQTLAAEAANAWRTAAAPGMAWLKHRAREHGTMKLVFRCWRERVEHDTAGINNDATRWHVRRERQQHARPRRQQRQLSADVSEEKQFQITQLGDFDDYATRNKWSPWRETQAAPAAPPEDVDTDTTQLQRWRLKCDLMRIATYYRVTGAHTRAEARKRSNRTRMRIQTWAGSLIRERARAAQQPMDTEDPGGRESRKRALPPGQYSDTRTNRPRANPDQMNRRRTQTRQTRLGPTMNSTEIGKRLRDEMHEIAQECGKRRRRDRFGDG